MLSWGKITRNSLISILFLVLMLASGAALAQNADVKEQYNQTLNEAEKLYFEKKYSEAKAVFQKALKLMPEEKHPQSRINEINKILGIEEDPMAKFNQAVKDADALYEQKKYDQALEAYKQANDFNPGDEYTTEMILQLHSMIRQDAAVKSEYNRLIDLGNKQFDAGEYEKARQSFQQALELKPSESYPERKIGEIKDIFENENAYAAAIERADELYINKKYTEAREAYKEALAVKPGEDYPQSIIKRINDQLQKLDQDYDNVVTQGDRQFDADNLEEARKSYEAALELRPGEAYPKSRISMINGILEGEAEASAAYSEALARADKFFDAQNYIEAQMAYEKAVEIKPEEEYPAGQLEKIAVLLADIAAAEEEYQMIISAADDLFIGEKYDEATDKYREALEVKPNDPYPASKISEIQDILAEIAATKEAYSEAIEQADQLFDAESFEEAKTEYQKAAGLKPEESYPQTRITEINNILGELVATEEAYSEAIEQADQLFDAESFEEAKTEYQKAAGLKPEESYPQTRITEINNILGELAATEEAYNEAIAHADQLFGAASYEEAKAEYQKAAGLKPEETYPQTRITEINNILGELAATEEAYNEAIAHADQLFGAASYEEAKAEYQKAAGLKPEESYPQTRIAEINNILGEMAATEEAYSEAIAQADQFFEAESFEEAKAEYQKAAGLKPEETYPQTRITEINNILGEIAATEEAYGEAIAQADQLFEAESFEEAKAEYQKAAGLKPEENYPQTRITEINNILGEIAATEEAYNEAIAQADQLFDAESFEEAKTEYQKAAGLKPEENYPQTKITEINNILGEIAATEEAYNEAIAQADQLFETESFEEAKAEYQKAAGLKPEESYPQTRITEINNILGEIAATEEAYSEAIAQADQFFEAETFEEAKAEYQKASGLKPEETYPQTRITEINNILGEIAATEEAYSEAIAQADQLFEAESFEEAKTEYQKAAGLKPEESYPQTRIAEINNILGELAATEEAYNEAIAQADQLFEAASYEEAKIEYQKAAGLKPEESYPQTRITEINNILGEIAATEEAYTEAIAQADQFFEAESFEEAKAEYQKAAGLKPEETYPQTRITEINNILGELAETEEAYSEAIAQADQLLEAESFEEAKSEYQKAAGLKPEESYPQTRIAEINNILGELAATEEAYSEAIAQADQLFEAASYEEAKAEYQKAAGLKPGESYPQTRITEINNILGELAATEEAYNEAIAQADQLFEAASYEEAKIEYQKAAGLKPEESYPQTRIAEINNILGELAATEEAYNEAIAQADQLFEAASYEEAKAEYQKAAGLKPGESYPQTRITEINNILGELAATEEAYNEAIAQADQLFEAASYEEAKAEYQKASGLKPEETYPQTRITEINNILGELAATEEAYNEAIAQADQLFEAESFEEAKAEYQKAAGLKPEENYPQTRITEINNKLEAIAAVEEAYNAQIAEADAHFNSGSYDEAKSSYEKALEIKPAQTYPATRIDEIESLLVALAKKREEYNSLVSTGDFHFDAENFQKAKTAYEEAAALFPDEKYPDERLREIDAIMLAELERIQKEYNRAIKEADRFFNSKVYDNAIHYYTVASEIKPDESYPADKIREITKILEENVVVNVVQSKEVIEADQLSTFRFDPVPRQGRKESYVVVKAKNLGERDFRLFLNYGKGNSKNGGFVINIPESGNMRDYIVKVGGQYKWFSEDNDWISLQPEGGSVEVSLIQISQE